MESKVYIYGEMLWYKSLVFKKKWNQWIIYKKIQSSLDWSKIGYLYEMFIEFI